TPCGYGARKTRISSTARWSRKKLRRCWRRRHQRAPRRDRLGGDRESIDAVGENAEAGSLPPLNYRVIPIAESLGVGPLPAAHTPDEERVDLSAVRAHAAAVEVREPRGGATRGVGRGRPVDCSHVAEGMAGGESPCGRRRSRIHQAPQFLD